MRGRNPRTTVPMSDFLTSEQTLMPELLGCPALQDLAKEFLVGPLPELHHILRVRTA